MLSSLLGLVLAALPGAAAGSCVDGACTLPHADTAEASVTSSLAARPAAHLRTATFALG